MRAVCDAAALASGSSILAQRGSGPFRAAIRRERPGSAELVITLEVLNTLTLSYEEMCRFKPEQWCDAVNAVSKLRDAIPEASRTLRMQTRLDESEDPVDPAPGDRRAA